MDSNKTNQGVDQNGDVLSDAVRNTGSKIANGGTLFGGSQTQNAIQLPNVP